MRVFVADTHAVCRDGVIKAIEAEPSFELVGVADDGQEALERISNTKPDVVVLGGRLNGVGATEVLASITRQDVETQVVLIRDSPESSEIYTALARGAAGYVSLDASSEVLREAIGAAATGGPGLSPEVQKKLVGEIRNRSELKRPTVTERERSILALAAEGLTVSEISSRMHLAPGTVKVHLQRVYQKLGVSDRAAAVAEAMRRELIE